MESDTITLYRSRRLNGRKEWRWRYQATGNNKRLANGGESYQNFEDCLQAVERVCHVTVLNRDPEGLVHLVLYREDGSNLVVRVR